MSKSLWHGQREENGMNFLMLDTNIYVMFQGVIYMPYDEITNQTIYSTLIKWLSSNHFQIVIV